MSRFLYFFSLPLARFFHHLLDIYCSSEKYSSGQGKHLSLICRVLNELLLIRELVICDKIASILIHG